jgi:hypothetical protein
MSGYAIFAFVVTPAIVLALALLLFLVDEHNHRKRQQTPGE